jgi:succinoglycan biosynthesis protein ExoM
LSNSNKINFSGEINRITVAICCYNAGHYLKGLLNALVCQNCQIPFEILIIDNNSTDNTHTFITQYSSSIKIRYINETNQGIPYARNRAIEESINSKYLAFIDADEIPSSNWLQSTVNILEDNTVDCVGGKITIRLAYRPAWLKDILMPFYGEVNHSNFSFTIADNTTPIWSGNIAYNMRVFRNGLRFDTRYNRKGKGVGGGEDHIMFNHLLENRYNLKYEPLMEIYHLIPKEKVSPIYFFRLHYNAGMKAGLYEIKSEGIQILGVPIYMFKQLLNKLYMAVRIFIKCPDSYVRETMNVAYHLGMVHGLVLSYKNSSGNQDNEK